jgi:hypothetical protein
MQDAELNDRDILITDISQKSPDGRIAFCYPDVGFMAKQQFIGGRNNSIR